MPRSSTHHEQWQRDMERVYGLAELIVAKQRHGATGKVKLKFEAQDHPLLRPCRRGLSARGARLERLPSRGERLRGCRCPLAHRAKRAEGIEWRVRACYRAWLLAVIGAVARIDRRGACRRRRRRPRRKRRPTIPSPGSRRSRASARWPGRGARMTRTLGALQGDPRYQPIYDRALEILAGAGPDPARQLPPRRPLQFLAGRDHVRGIVRRTSLASYRTDTPAWETVLDVDALATAEGKSLGLSGHELPAAATSGAAWSSFRTAARDANVVREFDLRERRFVEGGFSLPEGKQNVDLGGREHAPGRPRLGAGDDDRLRLSVRVKRLRRGQTLDQAVEVYRGEAERRRRRRRSCCATATGRVHGVGAYRGIDTFRSEIRSCSGPAAMSPCNAPAARRRSPGSSTAGCWSRSTSPGSRRRACASRPIRSSPTISPNGSAIRSRRGRAWSGRRGRARR